MYSAFDSGLSFAALPADASIEVAPPFLPSERYPEFPDLSIGPPNPIFDGFRRLLMDGGYDRSGQGTASWNPLGEIIAPGETVLIKPNLVLHKSYFTGGNYFSVVTHPALIRAVAEYVLVALRGRGRLLIGDAPLNSCDFDELRTSLHLDEIVRRARSTGVDSAVLDFRLHTIEKRSSGVIRRRRNDTPGEDHLIVRLGSESALAKYDGTAPRYRVTEYDGRGMPVHHHDGQHEYCIHRSVLESSVIISMPKVKTHHKAGLTCAMKNYVGINGSKDWLPHHRQGSVAEGGDEYHVPSLRKRLISASWDVRWPMRSALLQRVLIAAERLLYASNRLIRFPDPYWEGSWHGNRTISRTTADLNRLVMYADRAGILQDAPCRRLLYVVDGLLCGEGDGPMGARPLRCGFLLGGKNAWAIDMAVATLMGFDPARIDTLNVAQEPHKRPLCKGGTKEIRVQVGKSQACALDGLRKIAAYRFVPPKGWKGECELREGA